MLTTGRSTPGWNTAHQTAMWSSGSGKPWSFLMKSSEHGCFSLWQDRLECLCRASRLYKVVSQRAQPGSTRLGEGSVFGLSSWFTTRCLSTDSLFTLFLICNSHTLIPSPSFSLFPYQEPFLLGFSVIVVSAARLTVCGDALPFHAPCFRFCCKFLWGKSVHCHLHISAWQNVRPHPSPWVPLPSPFSAFNRKRQHELWKPFVESVHVHYCMASACLFTTIFSVKV